MDEESRAHLARRYGHAAQFVLRLAGAAPSLAARISPDLPDIAAEAAYAAGHEQAGSVGDVLLRRTRLGLLDARRLTAPARPARGAGGAGDGRTARLGRPRGSRPSSSGLERRLARGRGPRARGRGGGRVILRLRDRELDLSEPVLMGIVNATPDSFSDRQGPKDLDELAAGGRAQSTDGAAIVDVGGESGRTDTEAVSVEEEIARVRPLVERLAAGGVTVSVDTWRAPVARAALDAGAAMINDVSGLSDERLAVECAEAGAALVITHTRGAEDEGVPPLRRRGGRRGRVPPGAQRVARRTAWPRTIVLDPGIDLAKTPAESVELLRRLPPGGARPPAAGRGLAQGLRRRAHRAAARRPRRGHARRRGRGRAARRARSCGCTTWRPRATTCACTPRSRASGRWRPERRLEGT